MPSAEWPDIGELIEPPYVSLTTTERTVVRGGKEDYACCQESLSQLFARWWAPMRENRPTSHLIIESGRRTVLL